MRTFGISLSVFGGAACDKKKSPIFLVFLSLSVGYQDTSAGEPSKKSTITYQHKVDPQSAKMLLENRLVCRRGMARLVLNQYNQYRCLALVLIGVLRR